MTKAIATLGIFLLCACTTASTTPKQYLSKQNISTPKQDKFPHCYNYGCVDVTNVNFTKEDWKRIEALFAPQPSNAIAERQTISRTIGLFEQIVGKKTGTEADKFGTFRNMGNFHHDCIDESTNTTIYLDLLHKRGLLRFHTPAGPTTRIPLVHGGNWPHRTAVIFEKQSKVAFAVDSWFHDNGFPAEVIPLEIWKNGWKAEENLQHASD